MKKIVIVGGGLSGMLVALNLLRRPDDLDITVIDKRPAGCLGAAYSTDHPCHLLNVMADKMSAFPDDSGHFTRWLSGSGLDYNGNSFVPRGIYRRYILDLLNKELAMDKPGLRYAYWQDLAVDLSADRQCLLLQSGRQIRFDKLVLALGNFDPAPLSLPGKAYLTHSGYHTAGLDQEPLRDLPSDAGILIIGSGLSMVDMVLCLAHRNHRGPITALSTHGLIPLPHRDGPSYSITGWQPDQTSTALEALRMVRHHFEKAAQQGIGWQAVVNAIRPFTQEIWLHLPPSEKRKFMEHLRHFWGVARHRVPQESAEVLHRLIAADQLSVCGGRIRAIWINADNTFTVEYRHGSSGEIRTLIVDHIVNCMGPAGDYERLQDPFVKNLIGRGLIRADALKLGLDCTKEGAIRERSGALSPRIYTIGPPAKGILWECTAVPEIRMAALLLANQITGTVNDQIKSPYIMSRKSQSSSLFDVDSLLLRLVSYSWQKLYFYERVLKRKVFIREFKPLPDDVCIVTYMRSGTTMLQMLLYQLLTEGDMSFKHLSDVSPFLEDVITSGEKLRNLPSPRCFKTHGDYKYFPRKADGRIICVIRNGMDVAASAFHYYKNYSMPNLEWDSFLRNNFMGSHSWFKYVADWLQNKNRFNICYIRYEDLIQHKRESIEKLAAFLNVPLTEEKIQRVQERSSFEFMKQHQDKFGRSKLDETKADDHFIRKGESDKGRLLFTDEQRERFIELYNRYLGKYGLGYDFSRPGVNANLELA
jgi:uncharacterized NAD(P)/FAD-binding protein YdhS